MNDSDQGGKQPADILAAAGADAGRLTEGAVTNLARWLSEPQYAKYQPRLQEMIAAEDYATLEACFWEVIAFGTGGRRGPMAELGSATINERTIAESAHGLATYFLGQAEGKAGRAVVTCDTRNRSNEFARLTATTLAAHGLHVFFFDGHRATPELSFAVRHLKCDVGVMISASHNPPSDNGFKAYWSNGGQVLPPHDKGIIECVYEAGEIPTLEFDAAVSAGKIEVVGEDVDDAYLEAVSSLSLSDAREMPAIFTPLHGVGELAVYATLERAGFEGVEIFEPQREPDGNFTNVPDQLPNPERPEVFAPAIERAKETGAELVLASDPDADRLGVCVRNADGEFVHLTGNRIGALLVDYVLRKRAAAGTLSPEHYVVETLVTTPLVGRLARSHNVQIVDDLLVGFKYIGQTIDRRGAEHFVFGCEESLGYLAGDYARDKCAAIAGLYLMELAAELRAEGQTLLDRLDAIHREHGYHVENQRSVVCRGASGRQQIQLLMEQLRTDPPADFAGFRLLRVRDFGKHEIRSFEQPGDPQPLPEPSGDLLMFDLSGEDVQFSLAVRPSGTEPKIKFYYFAQCTAGGDDRPLETIRSSTDASLERLMDAVSTWAETTAAASG